MDTAKYMVFLRKPLDDSLKSLLKGYIFEQDNLEFIFCSEWEQNGMFIYLKAANHRSEQQWRLNIPTNAVLSVADFSDERKDTGFTSKPRARPL